MDISGLLDLMKYDLERGGAYDRYPVRFFGVKYEEGIADALIRLKMNLKEVELFDLKDILPHEDGWITANVLIKSIKSLNLSKSYIMVGFSEYARFMGKDEFVSLLISLFELENTTENSKRRIYICCFALCNQIKKVIKEYHRRKDVYNPLINEDVVEELPQIYFIDDKLKIDYHLNEIVSSSEWFGMWRNPNIDTKKPIVCSSKTLGYFYAKASPDNVYNIINLKTYEDILKYMHHIDNLHSYRNNPDGFYRNLIALVKDAESKKLEDIILEEVNAQSIGAGNIYILWKTSDTFKRWLIQNYVLIQIPRNTYLYKVMLLIEDLSDREFLEKMYECIFEFKDISLVEDRKAILASIKKSENDITFSNRMIAYYDAVVTGIIKSKTLISLDSLDFKKDDETLVEKQALLFDVIEEEIVPYLTSFSAYERQLIIWLYRMKLISGVQIKNIYPSLWDYLNPSEYTIEPKEYSERFDGYFKVYRDLRLAQREDNDYNILLSEWNKDENTFYNWYLDGKIEYPEMYLKKNNFHGKIYILDGVGAEFIKYILKLLEERGYSVSGVTYGKCHLPSTSSMAKMFYSLQYEWLFEYDEKVIHGGPYYHVENLEKSLSIIERLIDRIVSVEGEDIFAIMADHGSTIGHKLQKKEKKYSFEKAEHDGRCWHNKDRQYTAHTKDYIVYDDEFGEQWVVCLNQQSLYNNSKYAVHGGATLEEVLVPVIIANKDKGMSTVYKVKAINLEVSGLDNNLKFEIIPMPKNIKPLLKAKDGTDSELIYDNNAKIWTGKLNRPIEQDIEIIIDRQVFEYRTTSLSNMEDDLFDD